MESWLKNSDSVILHSHISAIVPSARNVATSDSFSGQIYKPHREELQLNAPLTYAIVLSFRHCRDRGIEASHVYSTSPERQVCPRLIQDAHISNLALSLNLSHEEEF